MPAEDDEEEEEGEQNGESRFAVVNMRTYSVISSCAFQAVEREMDVLDWSICQIKSLIDAGENLSSQSNDAAGDQLEGLEHQVIARFTNIEKVLLKCVKSHMSGVTVEILLKTVTKWFRSLTALVKCVSHSFHPSIHLSIPSLFPLDKDKNVCYLLLLFDD
jgi:hypothetical protein